LIRSSASSGHLHDAVDGGVAAPFAVVDECFICAAQLRHLVVAHGGSQTGAVLVRDRQT